MCVCVCVVREKGCARTMAGSVRESEGREVSARCDEINLVLQITLFLGCVHYIIYIYMLCYAGIEAFIGIKATWTRGIQPWNTIRT